MGKDQARNTSGCGGREGMVLGRLLRSFVVVRSRHRGDELAGPFEVRLLDKNLELGHPVDGQRIDEGRRLAADDRSDAVAFEEVLDQVRFERAVNARGLGEVGGISRRAAVVMFRHGVCLFRDAR